MFMSVRGYSLVVVDVPVNFPVSISYFSAPGRNTIVCQEALFLSGRRGKARLEADALVY